MLGVHNLTGVQCNGFQVDMSISENHVKTMKIDDFGATFEKWVVIRNGTSHIALAHWEAIAVGSSSSSYNTSRDI